MLVVCSAARSSSLSIDSRARGRQRDPLGPPPGRRRRFHFRSVRFGAAAIAPSVSGATRSGRLGGASPISFSSNSFSRYSDSGANAGARAFGADADDDGVVAAAPASYGVIANRRHRKTSSVASRVPPLYPLTRAREGRADLSAVGQQRDPLAPPAGRRRRFHFRSIRFGAAAIAASVGGATRSGRLGGAAAAGRRSPSGRRWSFGRSRRRAPASHGVIANRRH